MATPKKLPSGSYRIRVFSHIDENGKKIYKSFTDKDKKVVMKLARDFENLKDEGLTQDKELTFEAALKIYLEEKKHKLSPKTYREYYRMAVNEYDSIITGPFDFLKIDYFKKVRIWTVHFIIEMV